MKVIYEFDLDREDANDKFNLNLTHHSFDMYSALDELSNLRRSLYKGWNYYKEDEEQKEDQDSKYSLINVDQLLDDIDEILCDSHFYDIQNN